jgi:hypothetical protein
MFKVVPVDQSVISNFKITLPLLEEYLCPEIEEILLVELVF